MEEDKIIYISNEISNTVYIYDIANKDIINKSIDDLRKSDKDYIWNLVDEIRYG